MKHFLAIDQGGSKTEALVFNGAGEILAFGDDRGFRRPGESYAHKQGDWILCAAQNAADRAGVALDALDGVCCALNGADWPEDYDRLRTLVSGTLGVPEGRITIVNDCVGAMRGGANSGSMGVLCAGTGMNIAVRAADGREHVFGYFVTPQDQGGGALGTRTWQSILDAYNGLGPKTLLSELILTLYGEPDLVTLYKKFTGGRVVFKNYELCPILMRAAKAGDAVSLEILHTAARRMLHYIAEGIRMLGLEDETLSLVLTGGVFKGDGDVFFDTIEQLVKEYGINAACVPARYEPVAGTALLLLDTVPPPGRTAALAQFEKDAARMNLRLNIGGKQAAQLFP